MEQQVLAVIKEIQEEREAANILPVHVLTSEIINRGCKDPYKTLNKLCIKGKLTWRRTINDIAFTIKEEGK